MLESVYGARKPSGGTVTVDGQGLRAGSVGAAVRAGIGLAPEERKSQGLLLDQPIYQNITVCQPRPVRARRLHSGSSERASAFEWTKALDVRPSGVERPVRTLSGGNQQKVVLARWLLRECRVLLLDEPTRGVDVGARSEIYTVDPVLGCSRDGGGLVSSEVEEVLGLVDRVLVVREGRIVHSGPAEDIDEHKVLDLVMEGSAL